MAMRAIDWFLRSRVDGRIVVGQFPNLPLWLFGAAWIAGSLAGDGPVGRWSHIAADAFLTWWAADELLRGVNPWRRCLGAGVLLWLGFVWISGTRLTGLSVPWVR